MDVVARFGHGTSRSDTTTLERIDRERDEALTRFRKSRDLAALQTAMTRLDAQESTAREPTYVRQLEPAKVLAYLRSLPTMWADAGAEGRQALATSIFARMDVRGFERMEYALTEDAVRLGLNAALPAMLELGGSFAEFGRSGRSQTSTTDLLVPAVWRLPMRVA